MDIMNILYFLGASVLLTLMPGPDILFVITESISKSQKTGIFIALGLCTGLIVHTTAAALGIAAVLYHSAVAFQVVKFAGALYLFYLAWQALRERGNSKEEVLSASAQQTFFALYRRGIFMNLLNPKVSLFFLAFLPQFVSPRAGSVALQMALLGVLFMLQSLVVFTTVALLANRFGKYLFNHEKSVLWINRAKAGIYTFLGARLVFLSKES
ncbi:LysE family translocator [Desulforamulus ruminis]|uniref:LysE family translocator n=1 Tax=Desulforamulus ruminis TaxID=1564 RepID=UPI002FD9FC1D